MQFAFLSHPSLRWVWSLGRLSVEPHHVKIKNGGTIIEHFYGVLWGFEDSSFVRKHSREGCVIRECSIKYYSYLLICEGSSVSSSSESSTSGGILLDCGAGGDEWTIDRFGRVGGVVLLTPCTRLRWRYMCVAAENVFSHSVHWTGISMFLGWEWINVIWFSRIQRKFQRIN